jgi:hypothetical protein
MCWDVENGHPDDFAFTQVRIEHKKGNTQLRSDIDCVLIHLCDGIGWCDQLGDDALPIHRAVKMGLPDVSVLLAAMPITSGRYVLKYVCVMYKRRHASVVFLSRKFQRCIWASISYDERIL